MRRISVLPHFSKMPEGNLVPVMRGQDRKCVIEVIEDGATPVPREAIWKWKAD